jgi:hypothetical protein
LHVDGSFDAVIDGESVAGVFVGPTTPGDATVQLSTADGVSLSLSFRSALAASSPAQAVADVAPSAGRAAQSLVAPWMASTEGMCGATGGTWRDDDADPETGLYCACADDRAYMPSRGGCVARRDADDPERIPVSDAARARAGTFAGTRRLHSIELASDGHYVATVDGVDEKGTWWDAPDLGTGGDSVTIACTSPTHAFVASLGADATLTVRWPSGDTESLGRQSP